MEILRKYPSATRSEVMSLIKEISKNTMSEADIVKYIPKKYLSIFNELLTSLYNSKKKKKILHCKKKNNKLKS